MRRILFSLSLCIGVCLSAEARKIAFDDLYSIPSYDDIRISPDGKQIVFVLTTRDVIENTTAEHIWVMNNDGTGLGQLTDGPTDEWHPRWSHDGTAVFFLSDRKDEVDQIWRLPLGGGEAQCVSQISTGVSYFEVPPSGGGLIAVSKVFPDCHTDSCRQARLRQREDDPIKARLYDKLLYRHYNRWDDGRVNRLFIIDMADAAERELYSGPNDVPTALLGDEGDFAVSPDGREVCFAMNTDTMPAVRVNNDLFVVPVIGGDPARITDNPALDVYPNYSPDGRYIAYHAMARPGYESDQRDIVLFDGTNRQRVNLTDKFDRSIGSYAWSPDSRHIYFTAIEHGLQKVWRLDIASGNIELLLGDAVYSDLSVSPDGTYLIVSRSLSHQPYELHRYDLDTRSLTRLTTLTEKIIAGIDMTPADDFWFTGAMGDSVHGFLTLPPDFNPSQKYPLALLIHGGPQWCWLGDFNYYGWNTQLMAAQGYVVAQIDPHGSVGYGITFKEYVSGNWGRGDYEDLMIGVDYLIETCPYIDTTRIAALGRSYGGFMINWISGHTDRFACLIGIDGTCNHVSGYGSTEELWFPEWEYKGTPWNNWDEYVRSSPVKYAANFKTPTMIIHGQKDYRVDLSEGLQMFTALQRMGVPSQLLYFPDEGHSVRKLKNLRLVYEKQFEWLKRWLEK